MALSWGDKLRLLAKLNSTTNAVEQGIAMKDSTRVIVAVIGLLTTVAQIPTVQSGVAAVFQAHPGAVALLGGIITILTTLHVPVKQ